ncbi:MAG TPA: hypothetical protein VKP11_09875 [Frankiaceae bacterium]|nr:hypothetical protein [Frankiaceae bacterium]
MAEPPQRPGQPQRQLRLPALDRPPGGGPQVVQLDVEPVEPAGLRLPGEVRLGLLGQREVVQGVGAQDGLAFRVGVELLAYRRTVSSSR